MTYELAQKLKDAGFPDVKFCGNSLHDVELCTEDECGESFPTLSELIEACGECISHTKQILNAPSEGRWWAVSHCGHTEHEYHGNNLEECGSTPEEAVAKLWLALNKK